MSHTTLIDVAALGRLLERTAETAGGSPPVLLDCRFDLGAPAAGRAAFARAHLPGAHYADLDRDLAGPVTASSGRHPLPDPAALEQRLAAFGVGPGVQVVAYDDAGGAFAARAWWLLRWLGHSSVAVLDGGYRAWVAMGGALESGDTAGAADGPHPLARATPAVELGTVVSADEVLRALRDPNRLVVDARARERYAGTVEPIDPVAGHVAGAVNHPFADNLGPDGRFLAADELRRRYTERLGGTAPCHTIVMCGSGVTACHDLLAMEHAGLPGAKLYAGSWSEWIRDPDRPVVRGGAR